MPEIKEGCATCKWILTRCSGKCEDCALGIVRSVKQTDCKCIECYNEKSDTYENYEADEELTRYFGEG